MSHDRLHVPVLLLQLASAALCHCEGLQYAASPPANTQADASDSDAYPPDASASDATSEDGKHSGCPTTLPGPPMIEISVDGVPAYCIDSREISQGEYFEFLRAFLKDPAVSDELKDDAGVWPSPAGCEWNVALTPGYLDEPCYSQSPFAFSRNSSYKAYPVACVNWCSAASYCLWAGKRLCGRIGGGSLTASEVTDPAKGEWDNVCTQGGKTPFGYGDSFDPAYPTPWYVPSGGGFLQADSPAQCRGSLPPYDAIQGIGCSVAEWQDACETTPNATLCSVQTVPVQNQPLEPRCEYRWEALWQRPDPYVGFRCCHD